jgi:hypothetical protein
MAGKNKGRKGNGGNGHAQDGDATKSDRRKAASAGHNVKITKSAIRGYASRYNELLNDKDTLNGECMNDVKALLEQAANETGMARSILRKALKEDRDERKRIAKEKALEPDQRSHLKSLRSVLGTFADTALGRAAVERDEGHRRRKRERLDESPRPRRWLLAWFWRSEQRPQAPAVRIPSP